ncbi:MAG: hypothetical protein ACLRQF_19520 [Thomasclavelia ramosa]
MSLCNKFARYFMKSKPNTVLTTANYLETGVGQTSGIICNPKDKWQLC